MAIGIGLFLGRWMRAVLLLLFVQMLGTITPLFLFPAETLTIFPIAPTLEGQYIIKNVVIVASAIVLGATVGGELSRNPVVETRPTDAVRGVTVTRMLPNTAVGPVRRPRRREPTDDPSLARPR